MPKLYSTFLLLTVGTLFMNAQSISFGLTGGLPVSSLAAASNESLPFTVGPSIEFRLRGRFALEVDGLYERVGSNETFVQIAGDASSSGTVRWRGNVWEFPVIAKYYFHAHKSWQPFAGSGLGARWLTRQEDVSQLSSLPLSTLLMAHYSGWRVTGGLVAEAGIHLRSGRIQWTPEFRYARWGANGPLSRPNEASLLLGVHF
ncbi:MAG TPA: outer membrane beta-barrel protein [Bryobacteraceae bacterium]|nr:outer membrane beta-barrel protein [Bryobacteraceae bacterium]